MARAVKRSYQKDYKLASKSRISLYDIVKSRRAYMRAIKPMSIEQQKLVTYTDKRGNACEAKGFVTSFNLTPLAPACRCC
jgi:hypothetical protein